MTLYNRDAEKDNCGFGLIAQMDNKASHWLVTTAIDALARLTHRGAVAADAVDGKGIAAGLIECHRFRRCRIEARPVDTHAVGRLVNRGVGADGNVRRTTGNHTAGRRCHDTDAGCAEQHDTCKQAFAAADLPALADGAAPVKNLFLLDEHGVPSREWRRVSEVAGLRTMAGMRPAALVVYAVAGGRRLPVSIFESLPGPVHCTEVLSMPR